MQWADIDSDDSDDEEMHFPIQHAGLNDGTVQELTNLDELEEASAQQSDEDSEAIDSDDESDGGESDNENEKEALRLALQKAREEKKTKRGRSQENS